MKTLWTPITTFMCNRTQNTNGFPQRVSSINNKKKFKFELCMRVISIYEKDGQNRNYLRFAKYFGPEFEGANLFTNINDLKT